jgi:hypothetical protein
VNLPKTVVTKIARWNPQQNPARSVLTAKTMTVMVSWMGLMTQIALIHQNVLQAK